MCIRDRFKQLVFLCLARLYSVFCPSEISDIQARITEQTGQRKELIEKETNRFLSQVDAHFLVSHLLSEARYPQRKEELDLEEANISLELAYLRVEEVDVELDTTREQLRHLKEKERATGSTREGEQEEQHDHDRTRSRGMSNTERTLLEQ